MKIIAMKIFLTSFWGLAVLGDAVTTYLGMQQPAVKETNLILSSLPLATILAVNTIICIGIGLVFWFGVKRWSWLVYPFIIFLLIKVFAVGHNIALL